EIGDADPPRACACSGQPPGKPCVSGDGCCNTSGGTAGTGTFSTQVMSNNSTLYCPAQNTSDGSCTSDADCPYPTQNHCRTVSQSWTQCWFVCAQVGEGVPSSPEYPQVISSCCDGLVEVSTTQPDGGVTTACMIASGGLCFYDYQCASGHCIPGIATAACQ
ncbi:MAG TPA: hypothetical protein VKU41_32395, partial [Polyangiaceae bacterium]|nr:hypothetical protein [Polyangiaceae bacterium]